MKWCTFFFAVLPIAGLAEVAGQTIVSKQIVSFESGVICAPPTVGSSPAPNTIAGTTHLIDQEPPFVSTGNRVPAVIGIGFGVKAQALDFDGIADVTMTISHPAMGKTNTKIQTFQTVISGQSPSLTFYQFDFDYEMVTGTWQMEAVQGGKRLYQTTFTVLPPSQVPELASICGFEELLS